MVDKGGDSNKFKSLDELVNEDRKLSKSYVGGSATKKRSDDRRDKRRNYGDRSPSNDHKRGGMCIASDVLADHVVS